MIGRDGDVVVVGGGVIGLAIAWRAALRGVQVTVLDPAPGLGASHHGAGMLAPVTEVHYGEEDLLRLNLASATRYPSFVAELEDASGTPVGYRATGTLAVAFDVDDKAALDHLHEYQASLGLSSQPVTARECRELEPYLSTAVRGGLLVDGDHQVDPRRLVAALLVACTRAGVDVRPVSARHLRVEGDRVVGVDDISAGSVVLAAGCWSGELGGAPRSRAPARAAGEGSDPAAARGRRASDASAQRACTRARAADLPRAACRRRDRRWSHQRGKGIRYRLTVEGTGDLLADARELLPRVSEIELVEASVGLRPGSPDNAPMIGASALPGLVVATGHYRNGILLAPVTADAVVELLTTGALPAGFDRFDPCRFARAEVPA